MYLYLIMYRGVEINWVKNDNLMYPRMKRLHTRYIFKGPAQRSLNRITVHTSLVFWKKILSTREWGKGGGGLCTKWPMDQSIGIFGISQRPYCNPVPWHSFRKILFVTCTHMANFFWGLTHFLSTFFWYNDSVRDMMYVWHYELMFFWGWRRVQPWKFTRPGVIRWQYGIFCWMLKLNWSFISTCITNFIVIIGTMQPSPHFVFRHQSRIFILGYGQFFIYMYLLYIQCMYIIFISRFYNKAKEA